jgi:hypothetical protein
MAGKGGHSDFVRNPDVQSFLADCDYLRVPSDAEGKAMAAAFGPAPGNNPPILPLYVVASDASKSDTPISDKLPSTQIGFIKVSHVLIEMDKYAELIDPQTRFVDPFKVAELHRNAAPITYTLPGSNVRYRGATTVRDGFREAVFTQLAGDKSNGGPNKLVLTDILLDLCEGAVTVSKCPACGRKHDFVFSRAKIVLPCTECGNNVYVTDWLRLHEDVSDFGDNTSAMSRMMNAIEHLLLVALIAQVFNADARALANMAFVMDGPLAIFGQPAKLHARIMAFLSKINASLARGSLDPLLIIGLQKTGMVMDHATMIARFLNEGCFKVIDDGYRDKYIKCSDGPSQNFGSETYWGQDFLFKTERGRIFNFALPYPFGSKDELGTEAAFAMAKCDLSRYGNLPGRACDLIRHFELDLYDSAIVPVALAHRHASISIVPGGKVLDIITKTGLALGARGRSAD